MIALMAVVAMTLMSSCGNSNLSDDPKEMVNQLEQDLKGDDGNKFVATLKGVPAKVVSFFKDEKTRDKAKEYLKAAQDFLKSNKDKVSEVVSKVSDSDAAKKLVETITNCDDVTKLVGL